MSLNALVSETPTIARYQSPATVPLDADFEVRWAAWRARGVIHEHAVRQTVMVWAGILSAVAAIGFVLLDL